MQPADLVNRSLDAIGIQASIGDLQEGTREAQVALRHYGSCMRSILRSAHWNFARARSALILLNDASGQTTKYQKQQNQPITVGCGTPGMRPWIYEYAWPIDCVKARFVPMAMNHVGAVPTGNIAMPSNPLMSGINQSSQFTRQIPAPFLVAQDVVPNMTGKQQQWDNVPQTAQTMGQALTSQTVILTNQRCADLVYTALVTYPDQWDTLFQQAFVAMLASYLAMPLVSERKNAVAIRDEQIKVAKMVLDQARISDGNEGWNQADIMPDWMRARNAGGFGRGFGLGYGNDFGGGILFGGWDSCALSDGSVY